MTPEERLAQFEKMKASLEAQYEETVGKMEELRSLGKQKTATYGQLMGNKLTLGNMLQLYKLYDLE